MLPGILLILFGLALFIVGGVLTNDSPGVERSHAVLMGSGFFLLILGMIVTILAVT